MALVPLSGVIDADDLNNNFDDYTGQCETNIDTGDRYITPTFSVESISSSTTEPNRSWLFTPQCDCLLSALWVIGVHATSNTSTFTVTCEEGSKYLLRQTIDVSATTNIAGTVNGVESIGVMLFKGLTYKLVISVSSGSTQTKITGILVLKEQREKV